MQLLDSFTLQGPNGTHTVLVHDVLGSLSDVVRLPFGRKQVKSLCRQMAEGLAFMHRHGVAHGGMSCHRFSPSCSLNTAHLFRHPLPQHRRRSLHSQRPFSGRRPRLLRQPRVHDCAPDATAVRPRVATAVRRTAGVDARLSRKQRPDVCRDAAPGADHGLGER